MRASVWWSSSRADSERFLVCFHCKYNQKVRTTAHVSNWQRTKRCLCSQKYLARKKRGRTTATTQKARRATSRITKKQRAIRNWWIGSEAEWLRVHSSTTMRIENSTELGNSESALAYRAIPGTAPPLLGSSTWTPTRSPARQKDTLQACIQRAAFLVGHTQLQLHSTHF